MRAISWIIILTTILQSCKEVATPLEFRAFLNEPCMIVNFEQDNIIEGQYLRVRSINDADSSLIINLPNDFSIKTEFCNNWMIGWGDKIALYDGGSENMREISSIDANTGKIQLGKLKRGKGFPSVNQRVVFWNTSPSGFSNELKKPIIDTRKWPQFQGESVSFGSIAYDSATRQWVMMINECESDHIQIYAATSRNLIEWSAANDGKPILTANDFKNCTWAGLDVTGKFRQAPFISDIIRHENKWFLFLDGYDKNGKRNIGLAVSKDSLTGSFKVYDNPAICPGKDGTWNDLSVFYAKVKKYKSGFIMFFDGRNTKGLEQIGMASSTDLINWHIEEANPVLSQHNGWRSHSGCTEPNNIEIRGDSILLMAAGMKKFKAGPWHHYISRRMYMDKSGNVGDAQLGMFLSTDGGKSFRPNRNNPIFINDYSNIYENDHMGGNFKLIQTDTMDYIFYQAKSDFNKLKYNILVRTRKK